MFCPWKIQLWIFIIASCARKCVQNFLYFRQEKYFFSQLTTFFVASRAIYEWLAYTSWLRSSRHLLAKSSSSPASSSFIQSFNTLRRVTSTCWIFWFTLIPSFYIANIISHPKLWTFFDRLEAFAIFWKSHTFQREGMNIPIFTSNWNSGVVSVIVITLNLCILRF